MQEGEVMSAPIPDYIIAEDFSRTTSCTADEWKILKLVAYWQFFLTLTFVNLGNVRWQHIRAQLALKRRQQRLAARGEESVDPTAYQNVIRLKT